MSKERLEANTTSAECGKSKEGEMMNGGFCSVYEVKVLSQDSRCQARRQKCWVMSKGGVSGSMTLYGSF